MIRRWIEKKLALPALLSPSLSTSQAVFYLLQRGLGPWVRGFFSRWRFKSCGKNLFLGKNVRLFFTSFMTVGDHVVIGAGSSLNGFSKNGVRIGNRVHIRENGWIQATSQLHDPGVGVVIGDDTYIGPNVYLGAGGGVEIGKKVVMGASIQILAENHCFDDGLKPIAEQGHSRKGIVIEDDVWIGNLSIILDGVRIGKGSVIGAGAVVTKDVPAYSVVVGNPARVIRERKRS